MPYRDDLEGDWDEDYDSPDDGEPTVPCPHCREEIHEEAQQCPHCGQYISDENPRTVSQPWWIILGALAVMYAVYRWTVG